MDEYRDYTKLIKWASGRFSGKLVGRYDYWDFFEEGFGVLSLCLYKWKKKAKSLDDKEGFMKYFKTSLFRKFRQMQVMSFCRKRFGFNVPLGMAAETKSDGGFNDVWFKELVYHMASFLNEQEKKIFLLMIDPPEALVKEVLLDHRRRQKKALIHKSLGFNELRTVRISHKSLYQFFTKTEGTIPESVFSDLVKSVKSLVRSKLPGQAKPKVQSKVQMSSPVVQEPKVSPDKEVEKVTVWLSNEYPQEFLQHLVKECRAEK